MSTALVKPTLLPSSAGGSGSSKGEKKPQKPVTVQTPVKLGDEGESQNQIRTNIKPFAGITPSGLSGFRPKQATSVIQQMADEEAKKRKAKQATVTEPEDEDSSDDEDEDGDDKAEEEWTAEKTEQFNEKRRAKKKEKKERKEAEMASLTSEEKQNRKDEEARQRKQKRDAEEQERKKQLRQYELADPKDYNQIQVPDDIRKIYAQAYPMVRSLWGGERKETHEDSIKKINDSIESTNKRHNADVQSRCVKEANERLPSKLKDAGIKEGDDDYDERFNTLHTELLADVVKERQGDFRGDYSFPWGFIVHQVEALGVMVIAVNDPEQEAHRDSNRLKLIQGGSIFQKLLERHCIDPKRCIPAYITEMFLDIVNESGETQKSYTEFAELLRNPAEWQQEIWQDTSSDMQKFFNNVQPGAIVNEQSSEEMVGILDLVKAKNSELMAKNLEHEHDEFEHAMPYQMMKELYDQRAGGKDDEDTTRLLQTIQFCLFLRGQDKLSRNVLPAPNDPLVSHQHATEATPTPQSPRTAEASPTPAPQSHGIAEASPTPIISPKPTEDSLFVPEEDIDAMFDWGAGIKAFDYSKGETEFGKLVATRACRTDNARMSRFILFAGTQKYQDVWTVVRGSDLGPGGAEALHDMGNFHVDFDLKERKKAMREAPIKGAMIAEYSAVIELPKKDTGRRTKAGKPYRDDMYVRIVYSTDPKKNPLAGDENFPDVEWLSRTECEQLVGKKFWQQRELPLLKSYQMKKKGMKYCREKGLHPDTKKPLREEDKATHPWLFNLDDLSCGEGDGGDGMDET